MKKLAYALISSLALAGMVATVPSTAQAQTFRIEIGRQPLRGQRYEAMRVLAYNLDAQSRDLQRAASVQVGYSRRYAYLMNDIQTFTQQASAFRYRLDTYRERPWELRPQVASLDQQAQRIEYRLRQARALPHTYQEWADVRNVLNRMNLVLAGNRVDVPQRYYSRDYDDRKDAYGDFYPQPNGQPDYERRNRW